jgi:hypothetical protein
MPVACHIYYSALESHNSAFSRYLPLLDASIPLERASFALAQNQ